MPPRRTFYGCSEQFHLTLSVRTGRAVRSLRGERGHEGVHEGVCPRDQGHTSGQPRLHTKHADRIGGESAERFGGLLDPTIRMAYCSDLPLWVIHEIPLPKGISWGYLKSQFLSGLSTFGDNFPQKRPKGSKNVHRIPPRRGFCGSCLEVSHNGRSGITVSEAKARSASVDSST